MFGGNLEFKFVAAQRAGISRCLARRLSRRWLRDLGDSRGQRSGSKCQRATGKLNRFNDGMYLQRNQQDRMDYLHRTRSAGRLV